MACASPKSDAPGAEAGVAQVRALLAARAQCVAELGRIDAALTQAYAEFEDRLHAAPAQAPVVLRAVPARGTCAHAVLCQVLRGVHSTSVLLGVLPRWSRGSITDALQELVASGWLTRSGASTATRYDVTDLTAGQMRAQP